MKNRSILKIIIVNLAFLLLLLGTTEFIMRCLHFQPGVIVYTDPRTGFRKVDKLVLQEGFTTPSDGIMRVDTSILEFIHQHLLNKTEYQYTKNEVPEIYYLIKQFNTIHLDPGFNEFATLISNIKAKPENTRTRWENVCLKYAYSPVNTEGFRSLEFDSTLTERPKVLLLGDSFTWGHSVKNITHSFSDRLLSKGYTVFNTGITCTDPAQYLAVAKKYIPILKPDVVIANIFLGNDAIFYRRKIKKNQLLVYFTNAGVMETCPQGIYFETPEAAYQANMCQNTLQNTDFLSGFCSKTAIGTQVWLALKNTGIIEEKTAPCFQAYWDKVSKITSPTYVTEEYITQIKDISETHGAQFINSLIRSHKAFSGPLDSLYPGLIKELEYFECHNITLDHYHGDGHYNEAGHAVYADCLDQEIRILLSKHSFLSK